MERNLEYTKFTIPTGYKIINGVEVPLSEEDQKKDRIYANSVLASFIPKNIQQEVE